MDIAIGKLTNLQSILTANQKNNKHQKLDKMQKVDYLIIPGRDKETLIKVDVICNEKKPTTSHTHSQPIKALKYNNCNIGIQTGMRNNITGVDVDLYKMDKDNIFLLEFENDILNFFDTFAVKTPNGGYHLYFEYEERIRQTVNGKLGVDIRGDNGYLVCPPSQINDNYYTVCNNTTIKKMPENLKLWLLANLYKKKKKERVIKGNKQVNCIGEYSINITKDEYVDILNKLPIDKNVKSDDYRGSYDKWLKVMRSSKFIGMRTEFIEWSKKTKHDNYDKFELFRIWDALDADIYDFTDILKIAKVKNRFTYKRLPDNNFKNFNTIVPERVQLGDNFFSQGNNYLVKSDTGTGKTTSFKKYIQKNPDLKFISIVSRRSLAIEQKRVFEECGIKSQLYSDNEYVYGDNIIITLESSIKLRSFDFSDYVFFFDEFDSIVSHLLSSSTLDNVRVSVFYNIINILITCKQFICVDADISNICQRMLDILETDYIFTINTYKHYNNVNVTVIYDEVDFYKKIRETEKYILCTDSKTDAEIGSIMGNIGHDDIRLATSDTDDLVQIDDHDKLIISPKYLYGLDGTTERVVYGHYRGHTINSAHMAQQLSRARNITHIYLFFSDINSTPPLYDDVQDITDKYDHLVTNYNKVINIAIHGVEENEQDLPCLNYTGLKLTNDNIVKLFCELNRMYIYKNDCYKTNKFLHLLEILKNKGMIINNNYVDVAKYDNKDTKKDILEEKIKNFNTSSPKVERLNQYLKIPCDKINDYKTLFINDHESREHFLFAKFFFIEQQANILKLNSRDDFIMSKCTDVKIKLELLDRLLRKIGLDHNLKTVDKGDFKPTYIKYDDMDDTKEDYIKIYRSRKKDFNLNDDSRIYIEVCRMYRDLFGRDIFNEPKQITVKKDGGTKQINISLINEEIIKMHETIYNYRKNDVRTPDKNIMNCNDKKRNVCENVKTVKLSKSTEKVKHDVRTPDKNIMNCNDKKCDVGENDKTAKLLKSTEKVNNIVKYKKMSYSKDVSKYRKKDILNSLL